MRQRHDHLRDQDDASQRAAQASDLLETFDRARFSLAALQTYARGQDLSLARSAKQLLARLVDEATPPGTFEHDPATYPAISRATERLEAPLVQLYRQLTRPERIDPSLRWLASATWLACALASAVLVAAGALWPAALLLTVRMLGSLLVGTALLPDDDGRPGTGDETSRSRVERCLMSHLSDVVTLFGVAVALGLGQRPVYAVAVSASACLLLLGTLTRAAAFQTGAYLRRRFTERVVRRTGMLSALVVAAALQPNVPLQGFPILALAAVGPAAYALLELYCVHRLLGQGHGVIIVQRRRNASPQVLVNWDIQVPPSTSSDTAERHLTRSS